ncbi:MAG: hypothetical protein IAF38_05575 [Bacteroidia bacterium]|nr:hypothetical protein [Bacteroidia bacterium]
MNKRFKFYFLSLIFFCTSFCFSQTGIKSVLILGDSYLKGHFGEFLQRKMHESGKYDVLSIAIGGAGSKTFTPVMKNLCCGFRVRQSCAGDSIKVKAKIPVLESAEKPTGNSVMKWHNGKLIDVLDTRKPDVIILVLGSNYLNAHEDLMNIIRAYSSSVPVIWIGPFDKATSAGRYELINKAIKDKKNYLLVKSDEIVEANGMKASHFFGKTAKKLSEAVYEKFEPFLTTSLFPN